MAQGNLDTIPNPFKDIPHEKCILVQAWIEPTIFNYFFRRIFVGERGPRNNMVAIFFMKLHTACIAEGINPQAWDEEDAPKVARILSRLNFNEPKPLPEVKPKKKNERRAPNTGSTDTPAT